MFYYLLSNSTLIKTQNEKAKNLSILLFASLIYLVIHAFLSFNKSDLLLKIKTYFWIIIILDIIITYAGIKTNKNTIISESAQTNQNNSYEHNFVDKLFSIKNSITNLFLNNNNNNDTDNEVNNDIINEKNEIIKLLKETLTSSQNINNNKQQPEQSEHLKLHNENITYEPIEKINKINLLTSDISKQQSTPLNKLRNTRNTINNISNISNISNEEPILQINHNKENITAQNEINTDDLNTEHINEEIECINDNLFKDNASESGSDMDFDISDFQNTLDL